MAGGGGWRVAFFGGSFDPPHLGHLAVARAARDALRLDTVLFAPVGVQPLKPHGSSASFDDRLRMTELAIAGEPGFQLSQIDAPDPSGRPNYTLDTLRDLRTSLPAGTRLFCLMGADSFLTLRQWHGAAEIPFAATLIVASRPGESLKDLQLALPHGLILVCDDPSMPTANTAASLLSCTLRNPSGASADFHLLPGLDVAISASEIREQLRARNHAPDSRPLVSPAVTAYMREHRLYGS